MRRTSAPTPSPRGATTPGAAGLDADLTDAELDRIEQGADSFGEALHMDGMCRPAITAAGDDRTTRLLARLGRAA